MKNYVLAINPGSTSTKIAVYNLDDNQEIFTEVIRHAVEEISSYDRISDQKDFRKDLILQVMTQYNIKIENLTAVVGRGGLLQPILGGTYQVNDKMLKDLTDERYSSHASNLGAILANEIANQANVNAYIVDPVVVDELADVARISGLAGIERRSVLHALNQKAVARAVLNEKGLDYESAKVIVVHMGGGISMAAHNRGKMIDIVNGLDGEGPYTPERTGSLPLYSFAQYIIDNKLDMAQIKRKLAGEGGLYSYLGETDLRNIVAKMNSGDEDSHKYLLGLIYQIAKGVGEMAVVLHGEIDQIILTGGVAYNDFITQGITDYVDWIAPVAVYPGEMEMVALYQGVKRVLKNQEVAKVYP